MEGEQRFAETSLSKKPSNLFWNKEGRIDTLNQLILQKSNSIFCYLCSLLANIVKVGTGDIQKSQEQILSEKKVDEHHHNTRRRFFSGDHHFQNGSSL